ncbi:MAG: helix-turn-helix transcriptional regulator [Clostridia bacterium]|nr:helix-turn-helix transcriptional regulator [Clostridia bacterium]
MQKTPKLLSDYLDSIELSRGYHYWTTCTLKEQEICFLHHHNCYEIGVVAAGHGQFLIGDQLEAVQAGDAVFVAQGVPHYSRGFGGCRANFVFIDPLGLPDALIRGDALAARLKGVNSCILRGEEAVLCRQTVQAFMQASAEHASPEQAAVLFAALSYALPAAVPGGTARDAIAADAATYMKLHYAEPLRIAALAEMAHLSVNRFRARFAAEYGVTPHAYLARIRADVGAELLRRTDMSVAEIAAEAGFADTSEFFRCFRNIHGVAPTKYRQAATASTDRTSADASGTRTASRP